LRYIETGYLLRHLPQKLLGLLLVERVSIGASIVTRSFDGEPNRSPWIQLFPVDAQFTCRPVKHRTRFELWLYAGDWAGTECGSDESVIPAEMSKLMLCRVLALSKKALKEWSCCPPPKFLILIEESQTLRHGATERLVALRSLALATRRGLDAASGIFVGDQCGTVLVRHGLKRIEFSSMSIFVQNMKHLRLDNRSCCGADTE
jgi:hypothetical protein